MQKLALKIHVVHSLPERTRLRLGPPLPGPAVLSKVHESLSSAAGVRHVFISGRRTILVEHERDSDILSNMQLALNSLSTSVRPTFVDDTVNGGNGAGANEADLWKLNGRVDARMIFPVIFAIEGLQRLIRTGSLFGSLSPFVLFYYAWDSYWKLQRSDQPDSASTKMLSGQTHNADR